MKRFVIFAVFLVALLSSNATLADEYYRYPGVGGYGISNKKINCPNCGRVIDATSSHMCRKASSDDGYSSSSQSAPEPVTQQDINAMEAKYPDLLINQTSYTPVDVNSYASSGQNSMNNMSEDPYADWHNSIEQKAESYSSHNTVLNTTLLIIGLIILAWFLYSWRRKSAKRMALQAAGVSNMTAGIESRAGDAPTITPPAPQAAAAHTPVPQPHHAVTPPPVPGKRSEAQKTVQEKIKVISDKIDVFADMAGKKLKEAADSDQVKKAREVISGKVADVRKRIQKGKDIQPRQKPTSVADELIKLNELHRSGVLTDEEFADCKRKLLS